MAISASSFSAVTRRFGQAGRFVYTGIYTGPASYTAGGEALTTAIIHAAFMGCNSLKRLVFWPGSTATGTTGRMAQFDHNLSGSTQGKIHIYTGNADPPADVTGATDQSAFMFRFEAEGS